VYHKKVIYYFLYLLEGVINFMSSIFNLYPKIDWSSSYWFSIEAGRIEGEMHSSYMKREQMAQSALNKIEEAKDTKQ
tara:strand:+ start:71 stop:301 length:231 start_codon:yes stop_codon:yes gene_type:complete